MFEYIIVILLAAIPVIVGAYYFYERIRVGKTPADREAFIEGLSALLDGDDRRAFAKFREVVATDSNNVEAYLRIGEIFRRNGKPERALQIHQDLSLRHDLSKSQRTSVLRALTEDYHDLEDYQAAERSLGQYNEVTGGDAWGLSALLSLHERSEDWDQATTTQEKLLKIKGELSRKPLAIYKVKRGDALAADRQYHQSRLAYKEALNLDDKNVAAHLAIGDSYLAEDRTQDAIGAWKRLVSSSPALAGPALDRLEKALFEVGKFGEIEDICRMIIRLEPQSIEARLKLAAYFVKKSDFQSAEEQLLQAMEHNPDSTMPALELARLYLKSKKEDKIHNLIGMLERKEEGKAPQLVDETTVT